MPQRTYPRPPRAHALLAGHILDRHARHTERPVKLPVPIELIIEDTYDLQVMWDQIDEPPDTKILGALLPQERRILLNERHQEMFQRWVGPERFTLAHELAHWVYDADDPNQLSLDLDDPPSERFCYSRESPRLAENLRIREVNANKLASHILLPEQLLRAENIHDVLGQLAPTAARWGVSRTTLRIRLEELGFINTTDVPGHLLSGG